MDPMGKGENYMVSYRFLTDFEAIHWLSQNPFSSCSMDDPLSDDAWMTQLLSHSNKLWPQSWVGFKKNMQL